MTQNVNDRSYGIVPVQCVDDDWQFLIVKHLGGHWAFPKGHPEDRESPKQAASRELKEETGLDIKHFFHLYPFNEQYTFFHAGQRISKTVIYYLAEVEGQLQPQVEELLDAKWVSFEQGCDMLSYPRSLQICQQSYAFLESYSKREGRSKPKPLSKNDAAAGRYTPPPVPKKLISEDPFVKSSKSIIKNSQTSENSTPNLIEEP